jgi:predicted aldo/keto reductase-like oxidoreductase
MRRFRLRLYNALLSLPIPAHSEPEESQAEKAAGTNFDIIIAKDSMTDHQGIVNAVSDFWNDPNLENKIEEAKQKGLVRYTGFTGHDSPEAHAKIIEGGYPFDASLLPVSVMGNTLHAKDFDKIVLPLMEDKGIAAIGMKGFGGSKRASLHGMVTIQQVVDYALSYPMVTTQCIGIDSMTFAQQAVAAALSAKPMSIPEREKFIASIEARGGAEYAAFLKEGYNDGACCVA